MCNMWVVFFFFIKLLNFLGVGIKGVCLLLYLMCSIVYGIEEEFRLCGLNNRNRYLCFYFIDEKNEEYMV